MKKTTYLGKALALWDGGDIKWKIKLDLFGTGDSTGFYSSIDPSHVLEVDAVFILEHPSLPHRSSLFCRSYNRSKRLQRKHFRVSVCSGEEGCDDCSIVFDRTICHSGHATLLPLRSAGDLMPDFLLMKMD